MFGIAAGSVWATDLAVTGNLTVAGTSALTGNVGIGTNAPDKLLTIYGSDTSNQIGGSLAGIHVINSNAAAQGRVTEITFGGRAESNKPFAAVSGILVADSSFEQAGDLVFSTKAVTTATYPAERMRILGNGSVGIGTNAPGTRLEVYESATGILTNTVLKLGAYASSVSGGPFLDFNIRWTGGYPNWMGGRIGAVYETNSAGSNRAALVFYTNDSNDAAQGVAGTSEKMRIRGDGNVGIGTTNPTDKLHVAGNIFQSVAGRIDNAVTDTSAAVNAKIWSWSLNGAMGANTFGLHTRDDAGVFGQVALQFVRSGSAITTVLVPNGNVGIGTTNPGSYKLAVEGAIRARSVVVDNATWPDYVFDDSYRLAPLSEVEAHIKAEKHLPGIPSAAEVASGGISLGDMQAKLLAKVEELTLHVIRQDKEIQLLKEKLEASAR